MQELPTQTFTVELVEQSDVYSIEVSIDFPEDTALPEAQATALKTWEAMQLALDGFYMP